MNIAMNRIMKEFKEVLPNESVRERFGFER
jgi:hypothetical protein